MIYILLMVQNLRTFNDLVLIFYIILHYYLQNVFSVLNFYLMCQKLSFTMLYEGNLLLLHKILIAVQNDLKSTLRIYSENLYTLSYLLYYY